MNIFTEIHSAYYKAAEEILSLQMTLGKPITERQITEIISKTAFKDSALFIPEKIIPKNGRDSCWGLLENAEGGFVSTLVHIPRRVLTAIQKSWLRAKLSDPRMGLFLDGVQIAELSEFLKNSPPLYDRGIFRFFDTFSDGDDYGSDKYRQIFRTMTAGLENKRYVRVRYFSGKGDVSRACVLPIAAEYSAKNDKFRFHAVTQTGAELVLNAGRITEAELTSETSEKETDTDEYFYRRRCAEPAVVDIKPERNGLERFMLEFASYEKESCLDAKTGMCRAKIWYDRFDETELLIMLLSFGPVIEIISPRSLRDEAAKRAKRQYEILEARGKEARSKKI